MTKDTMIEAFIEVLNRNGYDISYYYTGDVRIRLIIERIGDKEFNTAKQSQARIELARIINEFAYGE